MNIGDNIAKLRKEKGLKQEELANLINVSNKTISSYETNRSLPNIETLVLLSKALDTNIDNILGLNKENVNIISKKFHIKNIKNSIFKIILLGIILIIPVFYFLSEYTINFANILVKYNNEGSFDPISSARIFDNFGYLTAKIYLVYILFLLVIYVLYMFKKRKILYVISSVLMLLFLYNLFYLGFYEIINYGISNSSLLLCFVPSIVSFILALRIKK